MIEKSLMDYIPPEQIAALTFAMISLIVAIVGFFTWLFTRYLPKRLEKKLKESEATLKLEIEKVKNEAEIERLEIQNQLDQTQSNREIVRFQASEAEQQRAALLKIIDAMREDSKKRDEQHGAFLRETTETYKGIQANTAATLELLKRGDEVSESTGIKADKIIRQGEHTHSQIEALAKLINAMDGKLDKLEKQHSGNMGEKMLKEIQGQLGEIRKFLESMRDDMQVPLQNGVAPVTVANATLNLDETIPLPALENGASEQVLIENEDEKKEETK